MCQPPQGHWFLATRYWVNKRRWWWRPKKRNDLFGRRNSLVTRNEGNAMLWNFLLGWQAALSTCEKSSLRGDVSEATEEHPREELSHRKLMSPTLFPTVRSGVHGSTFWAYLSRTKVTLWCEINIYTLDSSFTEKKESTYLWKLSGLTCIPSLKNQPFSAWRQVLGWLKQILSEGPQSPRAVLWGAAAADTATCGYFNVNETRWKHFPNFIRHISSAQQPHVASEILDNENVEQKILDV